MEIKEIVVATSNIHKMKEYRLMLEPLGYQVDSLSDMHIDLDVEETGNTFAENSLIKANYVAKMLPNKIIIADDSGLEIKALNGFPGIYSARFMQSNTYEAKCRALIERLKEYDDKSANFTTVISLVNFDKQNYTFEGKAFGKIVDNICGTDGFGYDPIFYSNDLRKTFGEATAKEKSLVSHRGKALRKMVSFLNEHHQK